MERLKIEKRPNGYVVSHVPSGTDIGWGFKRLRTARHMLRLLLDSPINAENPLSGDYGPISELRACTSAVRRYVEACENRQHAKGMSKTIYSHFPELPTWPLGSTDY